jgi:hypothetical protein
MPDDPATAELRVERAGGRETDEQDLRPSEGVRRLAADEYSVRGHDDVPTHGGRGRGTLRERADERSLGALVAEVGVPKAIVRDPGDCERGRHPIDLNRPREKHGPVGGDIGSARVAGLRCARRLRTYDTAAAVGAVKDPVVVESHGEQRATAVGVACPTGEEPSAAGVRRNGRRARKRHRAEPEREDLRAGGRERRVEHAARRHPHEHDRRPPVAIRRVPSDEEISGRVECDRGEYGAARNGANDVDQQRLPAVERRVEIAGLRADREARARRDGGRQHICAQSAHRKLSCTNGYTARQAPHWTGHACALGMPRLAASSRQRH